MPVGSRSGGLLRREGKLDMYVRWLRYRISGSRDENARCNVRSLGHDTDRRSRMVVSATFTTIIEDHTRYVNGYARDRHGGWIEDV